MNLAKRLMVFRSLAGKNFLTWLKEKINENSKLVFVLVVMLGVGVIVSSPGVLRTIDSPLTPPVASAPMQQEDRWEEKAPMPTKRLGLSSVILDDKIYCIGGAEGMDIKNVVESYDIKNDKWSKEANINFARICFAAVTFNRKILIFGGVNANGDLSSIEEYDPTRNTWTLKKSMPFLRSILTAVSYKKKYILSAAGIEK